MTNSKRKAGESERTKDVIMLTSIKKFVMINGISSPAVATLKGDKKSYCLHIVKGQKENGLASRKRKTEDGLEIPRERRQSIIPGLGNGKNSLI